MTASNLNQIRTTVASAPGKVLVTGGYLVLDRKYSGCVVATDARFFCRVSHSQMDAFVDTSSMELVLESPQFHQSSRHYHIHLSSLESDSWIRLSHTGGEDMTNNPFIDKTLFYVLSLVKLHTLDRRDFAWPQKLQMVVEADNDFYSQTTQLEQRGLPRTSEGLKALPKCGHTGTTLKNVHKTGLGSSAALVTSIVASILSHFGLLGVGNASSSQLDKTDLQWVHNVAQFCHCVAQGKIGSGFDVSSAVFGSHVYRRFSPSLIASFLGTQLQTKHQVQALDTILNPRRTTWDSEVGYFDLPPGFHLVLADVHGGSNTPKMVSRLLDWRAQNSEQGNRLWDALAADNQDLATSFDTMSELAAQDSNLYMSTIEQCSKLTATKGLAHFPENEVSKVLSHIHATFERVRASFREISHLSQVPIEPPEQSQLLDACLNIPGVLMAGVPGAGGYDAIFCITLTKKPIEALEKLWAQWTTAQVCPLSCRQSSTAGLCIE